MSLEFHSKYVPYSTPMFTNCLKAYPSIYPNCQSYLVLPGQSTKYQLSNSKYITPIYNNNKNPEQLKNCHIPLQGQCFYSYIISHKNLTNFIINQDDIWILIAHIAKAFIELKKYNCSHELTHFRQYNIRKIKVTNTYKLLFHQCMTSQLKVAQQGICNWTDMYLSPQQLIFNKFVPEKSIVYAFGIMVLNLCSHCDRNRSIYRQDKYRIDQDVIKYKIKIAKTKYGYSKSLVDFIGKCLQISYRKRWDFVGMYRHLLGLSKKNYCKQVKILKAIFPIYQKQLKQIEDIEINKDKQSQSQNQSDLIQSDSQPQQSPRQFQYTGSPTKSIKKQSQSNHSLTKQQKIRSLPIPKTIPITLQRNNQNQVSIDQINNNQISHHPTQQFNQCQSQQQEIQIKINIKPNKQDKQNFASRPQQKEDFQRQRCFKKQFRGTFAVCDQQNEEQEQEQERFPEKQKIKQKYLQQSYRNVFGSSSQQNQQVSKVISKTPGSIKKQSIQQKNSPTSMNFKVQFQQDSLNNTNNIPFKMHQFQIPQLKKLYINLKLKDCLKTLPQLVLKINKIGIWAQGDIYYGDLFDGKRNGLGLQIYANGEYYYGYFKNDLYETAGFYYWNKHQYFLGKFSKGNKLWGVQYDDVIYQGQFENNQKHGIGTCWYPTGQIYSGSWHNGKRHGEGFIIQPNGPQFEGIWFEGQRKGEGYLQNNNMRIIGYWRGQQVEGQAFIEYRNGDKFRGILNQRLQIVKGKYLKHNPDNTRKI